VSAGHDQDRDIDDKTVLSPELRSYLTPAFRRRVKRLIADAVVIEGYDNPYVVGRSRSMTRLYPDRHLPKTLEIEGKRVNTRETTAVHEATEWVLMEDGLDYTPAHEVANHEERAFVLRRYGVDWKAYCKALDKYVKADELERVTRAPADLDMRPFGDEHDVKAEKALRAAMKKAA
jgi:hypothetical protein